MPSWCMPVIPATREAEAGESLQEVEVAMSQIKPLHSSLSVTAKLRLKINNLNVRILSKSCIEGPVIWQKP